MVGDTRGSYAHKTMCVCLLLSLLLCGLGLVQATALQHAQARPPPRPPPLFRPILPGFIGTLLAQECLKLSGIALKHGFCSNKRGALRV